MKKKLLLTPLNPKKKAQINCMKWAFGGILKINLFLKSSQFYLCKLSFSIHWEITFHHPVIIT